VHAVQFRGRNLTMNPEPRRPGLDRSSGRGLAQMAAFVSIHGAGDAQLLVLVAPMIPAPGEAPADDWSSTRYEQQAGKRYDRRLRGEQASLPAGSP
jgi:hypothetical protein